MLLKTFSLIKHAKPSGGNDTLSFVAQINAK